MDAMALLCTLHADGPATLKGLRQAGCSTLEGVESMDEERLARILGAPAAAARRFAREARHLRERLGQGTMDREEAGDPACAALLATPPPRQAPPAEPPPPVSMGAPSAEPQPAVSTGAPSEATRRPPAEGEDLPPRPVRARPEFEFGVELAAAMREIVELPEPEPEPTLAPMLTPMLTEGDLDGLDLDLCQGLSVAGVADLVDLSRADPLILSKQLGLGYTRIWRLTALARRAVAAREEGGDEPEAVLVPVERPAKLSPSESQARAEPSILDLEWSRGIRPAASFPARPAPTVSSPSDADADRESAGGPFA